MCNIKTGIYQIILKEDGRSYIGSAKDIESRWAAHINNASSTTIKIKQVISRAIEKYGKDKFEWVILELCSKEMLIEREQFWLDNIRPFADENNGFNIRKIADSNIGINRTIESRKKQSISMAGVPKTEDHKKNMSENWYKNRDEHYFKALSEKMKGDKNIACRPEVRAKISKAMKGKTWKDDAVRVQKHIEQRKGKKYSDESRKNMSIAQQKNKTRSEAAKQKFSLAQRVLYEVITPSGETFQLYSKELKIFCENNSLTYPNLITTAKTNKPYKKGWMVKVIS